MAVSFGRQSGGSGEGVQAVFLEKHQSGSASPSNATWTGLNTHTDAWQIGDRDSGKVAVSFGITTELGWTNDTAADVDYKVRVMARTSASSTGPWTTEVPLSIVAGADIAYHATQHTTSDDNSTIKNLSAYVPFALSDLPNNADFADGRYVQFGLSIAIDSSPTFNTSTVDDAYLSFTSFGSGYGVPPALSIGTDQIADGAVTRPKIAADAVDGSKIADNSIGSEHIEAGAITGAKLATNSVTGTKIVSNTITGGKIGAGAITTPKIADDAITGVKIADEAITIDKMKGLGSASPQDIILVDSAGDGFSSVGIANFPLDGSITTSKIADGSITSSKIADGAVNTIDLADGSVTHPKIAAGAVEADSILDSTITGSKIASGAISNQKIASGTIKPDRLDGITSPAAHSGRHIAINNDGTGFVAVEGGSGGAGGISSVEPADLDGFTGGATDASKFVKTDSTGNAFEGASKIRSTDFGITGGATHANKVLALDNSGMDVVALTELTPSDLGLDEGLDEAGKVVAYNTLGTGFEAVSAASAGVAPTLANITGILNTAKGGTGISASSLTDLRNKLGITSGGTGGVLAYAKDVNTQKDLTIASVNSSSLNTPTDVEDGLVIRVGNDQLIVNLADGKQWKRTLTDNNDGDWTEPVDDTSLRALTTESDFRNFGEGDRGYTEADAWLPSFTDGSKPDKVIVGRNGDYLVAIDRLNFWWAPRPVVGTWASIPWRWETSQGAIPAGLIYSGGEKDEEHIPAGEDAVLGGQSGIDGEDYITVLVDHQVSGTTSTFTAYFLNDDASHTIQTASNTRGNSVGEWTRVRMDVDGIEDSIVAKDASTGEAILTAVNPSTTPISYGGYTIVLSGEPSNGNILYTAGSRQIRIKPRTGDEYLARIFNLGLDIQLYKDTAAYARGIVQTIAPVMGTDEFILTLRAEDFNAVGTLAQGDAVSIVTRGVAVNNIATIAPTNLGLAHGIGQAGKFVAFDATGNSFVAAEGGSGTGSISDFAVTTQKLANGAVTTIKIANNAIDSAKIASGAITEAKIANDAITTNKLADGAVSHAKLATDAVEPDNIKGLSNGSANAGKPIVYNTAGDGFVVSDDGLGGASTFADLTGINPTTKGGTGINASDLTDLRAKLGVGGESNNADSLVYSNDAKTQKDNSIHRVDSSTANLPTGVADGVMTRVGNDQFLVDLESGKQWRRSLTTTNDGVWTAPANASGLTEYTTAAQFVSMAEGDRAWTETTAWLPRFTDNSQPAKVILGRNGNYLVAIDRNNMWWAPRITSNAATSIDWHWEGNSQIPAGLEYTGGEADEEHIPAGEDAVLSGKTGIDGDNFITVLVDHVATSDTLSTFTAYFLNDDNAHTIQTSTNTRGYAEGTWARTRLDIDGISTSIFVPDTDEDGNERPAFVGVVPAISDLHFGGYTFKTGLTGISEGDVAYISATNLVWIYHKTGDIHLPTLFNIDYEVSLHKDDDNYIRGVFNAVRTFNLGGGVILSGAEFRQDDLQVVGTGLVSGDTVSVIGHKAVLTKTDTIDPINLGINHNNNIGGYAVALNSTGTAFEAKEFPTNSGGGTPGDGSVGTDQLADDAVTNAKLADDAVNTAQLADGAVNTDRLASDAVTQAKLADDSVGADQLIDGAVGTSALAADAITNAKIADDAVNTENIADDAITNALIADDAVDTAQIADSAVDADRLASDAVTQTKIADGAVGTDQVAADAITGAKIADDAIGSEHLADDAVVAAAIATGAVTADALGSNAVGNAALASNSVTPTEVAGITPNSSIAGHSLILNPQGTGFTTSLISGGGGGGSSADPNGRVYLATTDATDDTNTYSTTGDKTLDETDYTSTFQMANRSTGGGVFYFNGRIQHNFPHNQTAKAKVQARWASTSAGVNTATNWADCNIFNGSAEFADISITSADRNIDQDISLALPFNFANLPSGVANDQYVQFRVRWTLSANSVSNQSTITWTRRAGRYYGISLSGGTLEANSIGTDQLKDNAVTNAKLASDSVGSENLVDNSVGNDALADDAVNTAQIADGAVDTAQLAADAVTGAKIADDAVGSEHLADDAVTTASIADGAVNTDRLGADAVTGAKIADDAVGNEHIANGAVGTDQLASDAVTGAKIADDAVGADQLATGAVGTDALASDAVTNVKIADDAVNTAQIADGAITNALIGSDAVDGAKIKDDSIGSEHIIDNAVVNAAIADNAVQAAQIDGVTLTNNANKVIAVNDTATGLTLVEQTGGGGTPGDGSVGTDQLAADAVTNAKLADDAVQTENIADNAITNALMADDAIGTAELADGAVDTDRLAADAVTGAKIADDAIGSEHIADNAVLTAAINADAITGAKIADDAIGSEHLADNAVVSAAINADAVTGAKIADNAIGSEHISDNAILTAAINADAITGAKIADGAVGTDAIAGDAITNAKIADGAVDSEHLADGAVDNSAIGSEVVEAGNIASSAITTAKIADDAITEAKVADDAIVPANVKGVVTGSTNANKFLKLDGNGTGFVIGDGDGGGGGGGSGSDVRIARAPYRDTSGILPQLSTSSFGSTPVYVTTWNSYSNLISVETKSSASFRMSGMINLAYHRNTVNSFTVNGTTKIYIQYRWKGLSESTWGSWTNLNISSNSDNVIFSSTDNKTFEQNYGSIYVKDVYVDGSIESSDLDSDISNNDILQFRFGLSFEDTSSSNLSLVEESFPSGTNQNYNTIYITTGGGGGGGSSTPADGSIGTEKLAADAVTNAKIADDAVDTENIADDAITAALIDDGAVGSDALADLAVNTSKIAADAITPPKVAGISTGVSEAGKAVVLDNAGTGFTLGSPSGDVGIDDLTSIYKRSSAYSFKGVNQSTLADGEATYVTNSSLGTGQIALDMVAADSAIETALNSNDSNLQVVTLAKDKDNYVSIRKTGSQSSGSSIAINGALLKLAGTIAANDTVYLYYDSIVPAAGVARTDAVGGFEAGLIEPASFGLIENPNTIGGHALTIATTGSSWSTTPPANLGMVKYTILMRSNTGTGDWGPQVENIGTTRKTWTPTQNIQTDSWVIQNKATDWMVVNVAGLFYFGNITSQPICADVELWVRWRNPINEAFTAWSPSNGNITSGTRLAPVVMSDRMQIVKLFAGGSGSNAHVDCAVPSGDKFLKLSQLPNGIQDGDEIQFTLGFAKQTPSPDYNARNVNLTIQILDGSRVIANY